MARGRPAEDVLKIGAELQTDAIAQAIIRLANTRVKIKVGADVSELEAQLTKALQRLTVKGTGKRAGQDVAFLGEGKRAFDPGAVQTWKGRPNVGVGGVPTPAMGALDALTQALRDFNSPRRTQAQRMASLAQAREIADNLTGLAKAEKAGNIGSSREDVRTQGYIKQMATQMAESAKAAIAATIEGARYPEPVGKYRQRDTGRFIPGPRGEKWLGVSTAQWMEQTNAVKARTYQAGEDLRKKKAATEAERRYQTQERDEKYADSAVNRGRRKKQEQVDRDARRMDKDYATLTTVHRKALRRQEQDETWLEKQQRGALRRQDKDESTYDAMLVRGRRKKQAQADRDARRMDSDYSKLDAVQRKAQKRQEQDENWYENQQRKEQREREKTGRTLRRKEQESLDAYIKRPLIGGAIAARYERARESYVQTGDAGGGIGGMLFNARQRYGGLIPAMRLAAGGAGMLFDGIRSTALSIGGFAMRAGRSAVSMGAGVVRSLIHLPQTLFRSFTMIRHAFWNLTFMAGMAAGGVYAAARAMRPAGRVEVWEREFAMLEGTRQGFAGPTALKEGKPMGLRQISWIRREATKMRATVSEAIEAGRLLSTYNMLNPRMFRLASDVQTTFDVPLERIIMPFAYLKAGRYGQFIRSIARFGVSPMDLKRGGVSEKQMRAPGRRNEKFYNDVFRATVAKLEKYYGGMTGAVAESYETQVSNLSDAWFNMLADIGRSALPAAKPIVAGIREQLGRIGRKFRRTNFAPAAALAGSAIDFGGRVLTSDKPLTTLWEGLKAAFSGSGGIWETMTQVFGRMIENLPNLMHGVWNKLGEIMKAGADWFGKVFDRLPEMWDRGIFSLRMTMADIFEDMGWQGTSEAIRNRAFDWATSSGLVKSVYTAQPAADALMAEHYVQVGTKMVIGARGVGVRVPISQRLKAGTDWPQGTTKQDLESYYTLQTRAAMALHKGDWTDAASNWYAAFSIRRQLKGNTRLIPLDEAGLQSLADSLRAKYTEYVRSSLKKAYDQGDMRWSAVKRPSFLAPEVTPMTVDEFVRKSIGDAPEKVLKRTKVTAKEDELLLGQTWTTRPFMGREVWGGMQRGVPTAISAAWIREQDKARAGWLERGIAWTGLGQNTQFIERLMELEGATSISEPTSRMAAVAEAVSASKLLAHAKALAMDPKSVAKQRAFEAAYRIALRIAAWRNSLPSDQVQWYLEQWKLRDPKPPIDDELGTTYDPESWDVSYAAVGGIGTIDTGTSRPPNWQFASPIPEKPQIVAMDWTPSMYKREGVLNRYNPRKAVDRYGRLSWHNTLPNTGRLVPSPVETRRRGSHAVAADKARESRWRYAMDWFAMPFVPGSDDRPPPPTGVSRFTAKGISLPPDRMPGTPANKLRIRREKGIPDWVRDEDTRAWHMERINALRAEREGMPAPPSKLAQKAQEAAGMLADNSVIDAILGTSRQSQEQRDKTNDSLDKLNEVLEGIKELLQ